MTYPSDDDIDPLQFGRNEAPGLLCDFMVRRHFHRLENPAPRRPAAWRELKRASRSALRRAAIMGELAEEAASKQGLIEIDADRLHSFLAQARSDFERYGEALDVLAEIAADNADLRQQAKLWEAERR
jgi:hypothetical protein